MINRYIDLLNRGSVMAFLSRPSVSFLFLAIGALLLFSHLVVTKYAPTELNADILLNSVMSLQNVTLFYWGQNRLLNVLPFVLTPIKNPGLNLIFGLYLSAFTFFSFLLVLSLLSVQVLRKNQGMVRWMPVLALFLLVSSAFLLVFDADGAAQISFGHIEYSLPALLMVVVILVAYSLTAPMWQKVALITLLMFLATGLNPSVFIVGVFLAAGSIFVKKRVEVPEVAIVLISALVFYIWGVISKQFGDAAYSTFSLSHLSGGLERLFSRLVRILDWRYLVLLVVLFLSVTLTVRFRSGRALAILDRTSGSIINLLMLFALIWVVLFVTNDWVAVNRFGWRYFTFPIFGVFAILSILLVAYSQSLNKWLKGGIVFSVFLAAVLKMSGPSVELSEYRVLSMVDYVNPEKDAVYGGDYWYVWPAVFRDLLYGRAAYGLAYRGEGNRESVKRHIEGSWAENGELEVYCLKAKTEECERQIQSFVKRFTVIREETLGDDSKRLVIARP